MLAQSVGGSKFRGLEGGKKLTQSLVNKHCVLIDQWNKQFSSSFKRQRMGIWKVCVYLCHRLNRGYLSLI